MTEPIIQINNLTHYFKVNNNEPFKVLDDISFDIYKGEILGLVGESGSGKSTLARCLMNIYTPASGKIIYDGIETTDCRQRKAFKRRLQTERQIIFQDSVSALNQRMKIVDIVSEPMRIHKIQPHGNSYNNEAEMQLRYVGIDETNLSKFPYELSGGQRQRVAIARALSTNPKLLIADEPVASLDASVQAQIINLFSLLKNEHGLSILFIAHNLAVVEYLCDRTGVMYKGRLVELAQTNVLFNNPIHPYTRKLIAAFSDYHADVKYTAADDFNENTVSNFSSKMTEAEPGHFVLI